ncbi:TPA: hypothetical protein ACH3X3_008292 [Trebouxia sp. C0006]
MQASIRGCCAKATLARNAAAPSVKAWRSQITTHRLLTALRCHSHPAEASSSSNMHTESQQMLSVAPMMDWTDLHFRQLCRLISKQTWLYTEMVVDQTLLHNPDTDRFLWFPPEQHPIVCQLGGSNPKTLAAAAKVVAKYGYDEINLNCGCPSERVAGAGCFGAAMMLQPQLVAQCCQAMQEAVPHIPITVKCRLGVDETDSYEALCTFIKTVSEQSSVRHFIMHCRKCMLSGLNPAQNRTIPPLKREWVLALKRDFPHLQFSLNGVVQNCQEAASIIGHRQEGVEGGGGLHGVMIGRQAFYQTWDCLADADRTVFGATSNPAISRRQVLEKYGKYADAMIGKWLVRDNGQKNPNVRTVFKPLLNMFHGERGSKRWKQAVDGKFKSATSVSELLKDTLECFPNDVLDAPPKQRPVVAWQVDLNLPEPAPKRQCCGDVDSKRAVAMTEQLPSTNEVQLHGQHDGQTGGDAITDTDGDDQDKVLLAAGDCSVAASVAA